MTIRARDGAFNGSPVAVGAGFVQTKPGAIGGPGANNPMAGAGATSVTEDLPFPYKTNSWLSPILTADNSSKIYLGGGAAPGQYDLDPKVNPKTLYQLPVYPHPWCIYYNTSDHPAVGSTAAPIVPGFVGLKGLKLMAETVMFAAGTNVPAPDGGNNKDTYGELDTTPRADMLTLDPGYLAGRIRVARMGDYDAELVLRAADAAEATTLPADALLRMNVVRGNPLLYFTAALLPAVDIYHVLAPTSGGALTAAQGTVEVAGAEIAYTAWTGLYGNPGATQTRCTALFYPRSAASFTQDAAIRNSGPGGNDFYSVKATLTFASAGPANYFVVADLPDETFADADTLAKLARAAFSYPTGTTVEHHYDAAAGTVDAVYAAQTTNVLGLPEQTLSGLMPHHYQPSAVHDGDPILQGSPAPLTNAGGGVMRFTLTQGDLQIHDTGTWTCRYPVPGILPFLPPLDAGDAQGRAALADYIKNQFVAKWGGSIPPYTNQNAEMGSQSYQIGKFVQRNMLTLPAIAETAGDEALAAEILANTKAAIELYFREDPTQTAQRAGSAPYYTYYDPRVGSLFQYPQGQPPQFPAFPSDTTTAPDEAFGATSRCNDHQFHYGYFVHAAAQIAIRDPQWGVQWRDAINQYIFDAANTDAINPDPALPFPRLRYWDAYMNHGYSAGLTFPDPYGNNEESVSEELNFWAATALWGAVTGQDAIMAHGLAHFACQVHSSYSYWFDIAGNKLKVAAATPGSAIHWPGSGGALLTDAHTGFNTFFNAHPLAARVIIVLPVSPASFYLAMNPAFTRQVLDDYQSFVARFDIDPLHPAAGKDRDGGPFSLKNPFLGALGYCSQMAKYMAMVDPDAALATFYPAPNSDQPIVNSPADDPIPLQMLTDEGDSAPLTYHMVRYMQTHGTPDLWLKATNTPFYMVFADTAGKRRTYVGFNATSTPLDIHFSDGTTLVGVAPRSLGTREVAIP